MGSSLKNISESYMVLDAISNLFGKLNEGVTALTQTYAAQEIAEARLGQVMRNTMGATDEEIQSIKDLCAAQQELGVIGDEVQIAGAQGASALCRNSLPQPVEQEESETARRGALRMG